MSKHESLMKQRVADDRDPISGRKRQVEWPIAARSGGVEDATGRAVKLSEFGDWIYA